MSWQHLNYLVVWANTQRLSTACWVSFSPFPTEGPSRAVFTTQSSHSPTGGRDIPGFSAAWLCSALLGQVLPLRCEWLYISSGVTPDLEVWNTVFMLIVSLFFFFTTSKACCFTIQEPRRGFDRGNICYKISARRDHNSGCIVAAVIDFDEAVFVIWAAEVFGLSCQCPSVTKLSANLWNQSSLSEWVSDTAVLPAWVALPSSFVLVKTVIYELSQDDSSVMITVIIMSIKEQRLCTKKETRRKKPCAVVCRLCFTEVHISLLIKRVKLRN